MTRIGNSEHVRRALRHAVALGLTLLCAAVPRPASPASTLVQRKPVASLAQLEQNRRIVPDLYGLKVGQAYETLNKLGLRSSAIPDGGNEMTCVISQTPAAGTVVLVGATIGVQLATECPRVSVPDLGGMTQGQARSRVADLGLNLRKARYVNSDQAAGTVVSQRPSAGTSVTPRTNVDVDLSQGPTAPVSPRPESQDTRVPKLIGMTTDRAAATVAKSRLTMGSVGSQASAKPAGTVISQEPAAGTPAKKGSSVSVVVAAAFLVVPDVIHMSQDQAESALASAGFSLGNVTQRPSSAAARGRVIGQEPPAGTQFVRTSPVDIVVASTTTVEVPVLQGLRLVAAKTKLERRGLRLGQVSPVDLDTARAAVTRQSPKAHRQVAPGTAVDVVFASSAVLAEVWMADSVAVAGDSLIVGVDATPRSAGTAYRFDFGDHRYSPWVSVPRVKHSYSQPGAYLVRAAVRLKDGTVVLAKSAPITVTRDLTPILTLTVLVGAMGLPFAWKLVQRMPIPALHVQLVPRLGRAPDVSGEIGERAAWSLAIVSPGESDLCVVDPPGLAATSRSSQ